jgi:hypothetical protein
MAYQLFLPFRFLFCILLFLVASVPVVAKKVVLYQFSGSDGAAAVGPLLVDAAGNLFGVTQLGGAYGWGTVYELAPPSVPGGNRTETILYTFTGGGDGAAPNAGLIQDGAGNIYGTTYDGGLCTYVCGVVFELSSAGTSWTYTVLYRFTGADGSDGGGPTGGLVRDDQGNLYGTTYQGGGIVCTNFPGPCGTVFELSPPITKGGVWTETVLHSFTGIPDGEFPAGGLTFDAQGNLYGTTTEGGTDQHCTDGEGGVLGCGTVFQLKPSGQTWTESVIYSFISTENNDPSGNLAIDQQGVLYGTATYSVYRVRRNPQSGVWSKQTVYTFPEGIAGTIPSSPLVLDSKGRIFGVTASSGLNGYSTAFVLSPPASGGTWNETTLATFGTGFNSVQPYGGLAWGKFGRLYGATTDHSLSPSGYVFALTP